MTDFYSNSQNTKVKCGPLNVGDKTKKKKKPSMSANVVFIVVENNEPTKLNV